MVCDNSGAIPAYDPATQEVLQLYIGIIDVLQSYRFAKKFEHTVKSMVHDGVSFSSLCTLHILSVFTSTVTRVHMPTGKSWIFLLNFQYLEGPGNLS